jgi:8-oxo-dGTP diphosphatase
MWVDTGGWDGNIKKDLPEGAWLLPDPMFRTLPPPPIKYVVGFMFSKSAQRVVLIEKNRPDWQKRKLNGVGGKIELTDISPEAAMQREFYEETGIAYSAWDRFATLRGKHATVYVFKAFSDLAQYAQTKTDEEVGRYWVDELPEQVLPNLKFLIPLALTPGYEHTNFYFTEETDGKAQRSDSGTN